FAMHVQFNRTGRVDGQEWQELRVTARRGLISISHGGSRVITCLTVSFLCLAPIDNGWVKETPDVQISARVRQLADKDQHVRVAARAALVKSGAVAVPAVADALKDPDVEVRRAAAEVLAALVKIGVEPVRGILALMEAFLSDPDARVRRAAEVAL